MLYMLNSLMGYASVTTCRGEKTAHSKFVYELCEEFSLECLKKSLQLANSSFVFNEKTNKFTVNV